jgi:hypothetical protein
MINTYFTDPTYNAEKTRQAKAAGAVITADTPFETSVGNLSERMDAEVDAEERENGWKVLAFGDI